LLPEITKQNKHVESFWGICLDTGSNPVTSTSLRPRLREAGLGNFSYVVCIHIIKSTRTDFIYIGSTNDLKRRFVEHNEGLSTATKPYKPYELLSYIAVQTESQARNLEQYFKTGSGKAILYKRILGGQSGHSPDEVLA